MVLALVIVVALVLGGLIGYILLKPKSATVSSGVAPMAPAADVALGSEANPGPLRMNGVVPSGFIAGSTGAVAASSAYGQAVVTLTARSEQDIRAALASMTVPSSTAAVGTALATLRTQLNVDAASTVRAVPMGNRTVAASNSRATVDVWMLVMTAKPAGVEIKNVGVVPAPTEAAYVTLSFELVRANNDWKIAGLRSAEGPTPANPTTTPVDAEQFAKDLNSYVPFDYTPANAQETK